MYSGAHMEGNASLTEKQEQGGRRGGRATATPCGHGDAQDARNLVATCLVRAL